MTDNTPFSALTNAEKSAAPPIPSASLNDWVPIMPVPEGTKRMPPPHSLGEPSKIWAYYNEAGELLGGVARFDGPNGKVTPPFTYCEKGGVHQWRWRGFPEPRPLFGLEKFSQQPTAPVLVVEGEKAAEAAQLMFPDMRVATSPGGAKAASKASWSPLKGCNVTIWPDHDDEGVAYAHDVIVMAQKSDAKSVAIVNVPTSFPAKWDLADGIPDGWNFDGIKKLLTDATQIARPITLNIGSDIEIAHRVGKDLASRYGQVIVAEGAVWRYVGTHWDNLTDSELRRVVHRYDGATFGERGTVKLGRGRVDSILNEFMAMHDDLDFFADAPVGINCLSGFIRFTKNCDEPVVESHAAEHRCRHVIQGRWPIDMSDDEQMSSLLSHLLRGCFRDDPDAVDKVNLLGEVAGAAVLGQGTHLMKPKAVVLKGITAENGKSQIVDVIRGLVPTSAASAIPLGKFSDDRFVCGLIGKLLNASDELTSAAAVASDAFKQIITGEPITSRDVYRSAVTFRPIAQHLYATNDLPAFKGGMDRGVQRRLLVLTFNRTIPESERIEHIGSRISTEETDLLLDWAVKGAQRLLKQRYFTEPASSKNALMEWLYGTDPVLAWLEQAAHLDENSQVQTRDAYAEFRAWAIAEGCRESTLPANNTFTTRILASNKGVTSKRTSTERFLVGLGKTSSGWG
jgi:putative DNA primase/helicase